MIYGVNKNNATILLVNIITIIHKSYPRSSINNLFLDGDRVDTNRSQRAVFTIYNKESHQIINNYHKSISK